MLETIARENAQRLACLRGLSFIHQNSLEGENFDEWAGDYLWCFYCVWSTSRDAELRELARELGAKSAYWWMAKQDALPELANANEVGYYVSVLHVSRLLGVDNRRLRMR